MKINTVLETIEMNFKGKAFNHNTDECVYKTDEGKKCFIGLFIPDGHVAEKFKGSVKGLLYTYPTLKKYMPSNDKNKLSNLQRVHDASYYNLYYNDIENFNTLEEQKMYLMINAMDILGEN